MTLLWRGITLLYHMAGIVDDNSGTRGGIKSCKDNPTISSSSTITECDPKHDFKNDSKDYNNDPNCRAQSRTRFRTTVAAIAIVTTRLST